MASSRARRSACCLASRTVSNSSSPAARAGEESWLSSIVPDVSSLRVRDCIF